MRIRSASELTGLRFPTEEEKAAVAEAVSAGLSANIRLTKAMGILLPAVGLLLAAGAVSGTVQGTAARAVLFILAVIGIAAGLSAFAHVRRMRAQIGAFCDGQFRVADGRVGRIEVNPEMPGISNASFVTGRDEELAGLYRVRQEGLEEGTPLLLVRWEERGREETRAFTPFMLTGEGIRRHR